MNVQGFFDPRTSTLTYLVWDADTRDAVVIDPVLDFDPVSLRVGTRSVDEVAAVIEARGLHLRWILDTHVHADHMTGSATLKDRFGAPVGIGRDITAVQGVFKELFNLPDLAADGSQFDRLIGDGDMIEAGSLVIEALHTPGHTPACTTYRIRDAIFTGDTLFMPDFGTGRCDFPGGSAEALYDSIQRLYALPEDTRVFVGHDYQPGGRELRFETTIGACRTESKHLDATTTREEFVDFRTKRDAQLALPSLIFQSLQVNVEAGRLPAAEDNGRRYLKLPLDPVV